MRLAQLLAELCPGDIEGFLFPSGGGEANEAAIRMARRFTGKQKVRPRQENKGGGAMREEGKCTWRQEQDNCTCR